MLRKIIFIALAILCWGLTYAKDENDASSKSNYDDEYDFIMEWDGGNTRKKKIIEPAVKKESFLSKIEIGASGMFAVTTDFKFSLPMGVLMDVYVNFLENHTAGVKYAYQQYELNTHKTYSHSTSVYWGYRLLEIGWFSVSPGAFIGYCSYDFNDYDPEGYSDEGNYAYDPDGSYHKYYYYGPEVRFIAGGDMFYGILDVMVWLDKSIIGTPCISAGLGAGIKF